jgi:tRNA A-37 threonylcarbamoyl transferase component Bud32
MNPASQSSVDNSKTKIPIPFELSIKRPGQHRGTERVLCKGYMRVIPGNREVLDATWNNREVIVKAFSWNFVAWYRLRKEWKGLSSLRRRGINAPKPLFYGKTQDGRWAVVMKKVTDSATLSKIFNNAEKKERIELLTRVSGELARQHEKGVLHKDLNFGNLLLNGEKIFTIDPMRTHFFSRPVEKKQGISQLAALTCNLSNKDTEHIWRIWREYFEQRQWQLRESDEWLLCEQMRMHQRNGIRYCMKKCMRTNSIYLRIRTSSYRAVFNREFHTGAEAEDFVERIDNLAENGHHLKQDNTSCIWRLRRNGKDIVIRSYKHKGLFRSLCQIIKGSRAKKDWLNGHRLRMLDTAAPKPLAYIEKRKSGLIWKSYSVMEYKDTLNMEKAFRGNREVAER